MLKWTYLPRQTNPHSRLTILGLTCVSPLGAKPHPPGPNALFNVRLYLISGRYNKPSSELSACQLDSLSIWPEWGSLPGLISTSSFCNGLNRASATSRSNGRWLNPAKLVDQSFVVSPNPTPWPVAVVGKGLYPSFGKVVNGGDGDTSPNEVLALDPMWVEAGALLFEIDGDDGAR